MIRELSKDKSFLLGIIYLFMLSVVFLSYLYTFQVQNIQKFVTFYMILFTSAFIFAIAIADVLHDELNLDYLKAFPLKVQINSKTVIYCTVVAVLTIIFTSIVSGINPITVFTSFSYFLSNITKVMEILGLSISEELFFRGFLFYGVYLYVLLRDLYKYKEIKKIPENRRLFAFIVASIINSIFFAIYHSYVYLFSLSAIESLFIFGLIASFIYYYTDSLWACITFHFFYDLTLFLVTGVI